MNKQEMSEWLAVKVLGFHLEIFPGCETAKQWHRKGEHICYEGELDEFIYSPDGFFAVWDVVENNSLLLQNPKPIMHGYECYVSSLDYDHEGTGKDRYEAFYNAVYEAMK